MRMSTGAKKVMQKFVKAAPKSKTLASKVAKLTKTVAVLKKVSYDNVTTVSQYAKGDNLSANYNAWNVSRMSTTACFPVFGHVAADLAQVNKAYLNSKDVYISIRQNNEPNFVRMTLFLVSLKDQAANATLFDPATRQLTLQDGIDTIFMQSTAPVHEHAQLNPKSFTIHAVRRFTMGTEGAAGPTADTYSQRRFKFTIKPKQKLIEHPTGNMFNTADFPSPTDPSQNYFVIIANDNSGVDLENPKVDISVIDHWAIPS